MARRISICQYIKGKKCLIRLSVLNREMCSKKGISTSTNITQRNEKNLNWNTITNRKYSLSQLFLRKQSRINIAQVKYWIREIRNNNCKYFSKFWSLLSLAFTIKWNMDVIVDKRLVAMHYTKYEDIILDIR